MNKALVSIVIAVAGYGAWVMTGSAQDLSASWSHFSAGDVLFICALSLLNYAVRYIRWHWYYAIMAFDIPWRSNLLYYLAGFAFTATPGKAGEAVRSYYLKQHDVPYRSSLAALFVERLSDMFAVLGLSLLGMLAFEDLRTVAVLVLLAMVMVLMLVKSSRSRRFFDYLAGRFSSQRISAACRGVSGMLLQINQLLGFRAILVSVLLGLLAWGAEAYAFAYILDVLDYKLLVILPVAIYAISMLAGAISMLPGGLGGAEVVMALLLIGLGVSQADATTATLVCRVTTLWLAVIIGIVAVLIAARLMKTPVQELS